MRNRVRRLASLVVIVGMSVWLTPAARAEGVLSFHHQVIGAAEIAASTCPWAYPDPGAECTDWFVLYFQAGSPNTQVRSQPWRVNVYEVHYIFNTPDDIEVLSERFGTTQVTGGTFDLTHLTFASITAAVPMDDGSTFHLSLRWDLAAVPFNVAGNDGPIQEEGVPWGTHLVTSCITGNWHAHQAWREGGSITGSLDGTDVADLFYGPVEPFLGRGVFTITIATHGDDCEPSPSTA
jgi:hypothetical protein